MAKARGGLTGSIEWREIRFGTLGGERRSWASLISIAEAFLYQKSKKRSVCYGNFVTMQLQTDAVTMLAKSHDYTSRIRSSQLLASRNYT